MFHKMSGHFRLVLVESKLNVSDETAGHLPVLSVDLLNETSCQVVLTRCQDIFQLCLWRQIRCLKSWCSLTLTEQFVVVKLNQRIITACSHQNSWNTLRTLCCSGWCWSEQVKCVLDPQRSGIKEGLVFCLLFRTFQPLGATRLQTSPADKTV